MKISIQEKLEEMRLSFISWKDGFTWTEYWNIYWNGGMDEFLNNRTNPIQKYSPLAKGFSDFINVFSRPSNDHPENDVTMHIQFI